MAVGALKNVNTGRYEYFSSYFPSKYIVKYIKYDKYGFITILEKTQFDNKEVEKYLTII